MTDLPNYRDFWGPAGHAAHDAIVAEQQARRCACGGSHGRGGLHAVDWHDQNGWDEAERRADE